MPPQGSLKGSVMKTRQMVVFVTAMLFALASYAHASIATGLKWPTNVYTVAISGFGDDWLSSRPDACTGRVQKHTGIDLSLSAGTPVYATYDGTVRARFLSSKTDDWGQAVTVSHGWYGYGDWWTSTYHHIDPVVNVGQFVTRGQLIGSVHYTTAFRTHLHFGVRDSAYSNTANRGALPQSACGTDPAFADSFKNPYTLSYSP